MDERDEAFLGELRRNARESLTNMSRKTGIPISTLFDRLKNHQNGAIVKHTSLLDFPRLGYTCIAVVVFKIEKEERENMRKFLVQHPSVNHLYKINNGYDYMIEVVFKNVKEMEEFFELLEMKFRILEKKSFYVIEHIARELFLSEAWRVPT